MARIHPRTHSPIFPRRATLMGLALLSGCATPEKKPTPTPLPPYTLPANLLEQKPEFKTPVQMLGFDFFSDLMTSGRVPLANIAATPVSNGGVFIGVSLTPKGYETAPFPLKDFEAQIKPHAEPFQRFFTTLAAEVRQRHSAPEIPDYETHCFVLPLFRGTSLER